MGSFSPQVRRYAEGLIEALIHGFVVGVLVYVASGGASPRLALAAGAGGALNGYRTYLREPRRLPWTDAEREKHREETQPLIRTDA